MRKIFFDFNLENAGVDKAKLEEALNQLTPEINRISESLSSSYESEYASINLPMDKNFVHEVNTVIAQKKKLDIDTLIVVGIGGSNLGTIAVHKAIYGDFYNDKLGECKCRNYKKNCVDGQDVQRDRQRADSNKCEKPETCLDSLCENCHGASCKNPKVYFADTVDADYICDLLKIAELELKSGKNVLVNLITKSGTTIESIANFEIFLHLLKKYKPTNYYDYIVAITDHGSSLWGYASKNNISCLQVPAKVGGRYSVLSAVGLFPLGFLGINIENLLAGASSIIPECTTTSGDSQKSRDSENFGLSVGGQEKSKSENLGENAGCREKSESESLCINPAAASAAIIYENYINGKNIGDTFIFSKYLKSFGCWYRQLVGESIGKKFDKHGSVVSVGITPTVSVGSVDLHSVAQLYLGGPRDKFTTFITVEPNCEIIIPEEKDFEEFVENIHGKSLKFVMAALANGTKAAYKNDGRPFVSVHMPLVDEYTLGQLLQFKMLEIMYLGFLLNVNPFDQPQVELYKKEAIKILANKK